MLQEGAVQGDPLFDSIMSSVSSKWAGNVYLHGTEASRYFYLPIPFAFSWLLKTEGYPLGRFCMLVGPPGSCKSAFSYEMARLHHFHGGGHIYIETEKKDSVTLRKSTIGWATPRATAVYVDTVEAWMQCSEEFITLAKAYMDQSTPPRATPWCVIIDSLAATVTQAQADKIDKEGASSLTQPIAANLINTFMKRFVHWFNDYPISVFGVNHLKRAPDQYGHMTKRNIQGGYAPRFAETMELELNTIGKQFERLVPVHELGNRVSISVAKQALAAKGAPLEIEMVWFFEPDPDQPGRMRQRTFWDWYTASIDLLTSGEHSTTVRKDIAKVVDLNVVGSKLPAVWSKVLGIAEKEPVSFRQAGAMLEQRPDLKQRLYAPLGIQQCLMFEPGIDFQKQRSKALEAILERNTRNSRGQTAVGEPEATAETGGDAE